MLKKIYLMETWSLIFYILFLKKLMNKKTLKFLFLEFLD